VSRLLGREFDPTAHMSNGSAVTGWDKTALATQPVKAR